MLPEPYRTDILKSGGYHTWRDLIFLENSKDWELIRKVKGRLRFRKCYNKKLMELL